MVAASNASAVANGSALPQVSQDPLDVMRPGTEASGQLRCAHGLKLKRTKDSAAKRVHGLTFSCLAKSAIRTLTRSCDSSRRWRSSADSSAGIALGLTRAGSCSRNWRGVGQLLQFAARSRKHCRTRIVSWLCDHSRPWHIASIQVPAVTSMTSDAGCLSRLSVVSLLKPSRISFLSQSGR